MLLWLHFDRQAGAESNRYIREEAVQGRNSMTALKKYRCFN